MKNKTESKIEIEINANKYILLYEDGTYKKFEGACALYDGIGEVMKTSPTRRNAFAQKIRQYWDMQPVLLHYRTVRYLINKDVAKPKIGGYTSKRVHFKETMIAKPWIDHDEIKRIFSSQ